MSNKSHEVGGVSEAIWKGERKEERSETLVGGFVLYCQFLRAECVRDDGCWVMMRIRI